MARIMFLIFLLMPLIEIALFVLIGQAIGLWPTLLGVLVTAMAGILVLRIQGLSLLGEMRSTMGQRQLPGRTIADTMMIGAAGLLLLLPGYFSDLLGILLLLPMVRGALYGFLKARMVVVPAGASGNWHRDQRLGDDGTVDLDPDDWRRQ